MKCLIYLRVSTTQQAVGGNSIPAQKEACLSFIERNNYQVNLETDLYVDGGITGRTEERQAFQTMMERLKKDPSIEAIVAYDISRIFRNVSEFLNFKRTLKKLGKKFYSVSEPNMDDSSGGWLSETMLAVIAEFRSRQDGEKIKLGMREKALSGRYPGFAPYGYVNKREPLYGNKDRRWMEKNPIEAPWVTEVFRLYATGKYSLESLAEEMKKRGMPMRNGKPICRGSLEKILCNEIYIGHINWGGVENPNGDHEKLIDEQTFYRVKALRKIKNREANRERKHTFLLRGIAYCGECGARITGGYHVKKKTGKRYAYYGCQKQIHTQAVKCGQPGVQVDDLETKFVKLIKKIQITEAGAEKMKNKILEVVHSDKDSKEQLRKTVKAKLDDIQFKQKSALDKYVLGTIDKDAYSAYKAELEAQEGQYKSELARIEQSLSSLVQTIETAIGLIQNCYKTYKEAGFEQRILLAQVFFDKVLIFDKQIKEANLNHPFVYICKSKVQKDCRFQQQYTGGDGGSRTRV